MQPQNDGALRDAPKDNVNWYISSSSISGQYTNEVSASRPARVDKCTKAPPIMTKEKMTAAGQRVEEAGHTMWDHIKKFFHKVYKITTSHFGLIIILLCYTFAGAAIFEIIEGPYETHVKHDIIEMRKHIMEKIHNHTANATANATSDDGLDEEAFMELVNNELREYEDQLHTAFLHGINSDSEQIVWDFWGAMFFCATVYTTIGYGHIAPATDVGRIATMVYGLIGIPLCLVTLADLGKLFTRCIKWIWAFIRRFYYTGTCKKVRAAKPMQAIGKKIDSIGDKLDELGDKLDTINPLVSPDKPEEERKEEDNLDEDGKPSLDVDDEFNLPPIVAILITVVYIFGGSLMYTSWEDWTYLEGFYFVFVSISTIGFGDVLPDHPKKFLASFVYLLVGLSLVAMVINVVMEVVHDTIGKAKDRVIEVTQKTMGINLDPDADSMSVDDRDREKKTD